MRLSKLTSDVIGDVITPKSSGSLTVELADGERGTINESDLNEVLQTGGRVITEDELKREAEFAEAGEKPVLASAVSALRGATLGLSDVALKQTGLLSEQELQDLQTANPTASVLGEVAGTVAPTLLSGGAGLVGRTAVSKLVAQGMAKEAAEAAVAKMGTSVVNKVAAASPAALAESFGSLVGTKAAAKLSGTTSEVIKEAVKLGVGSSVEGALYGTGKLISEDQLGNAEFNAENLLATIGESAVTGGVFGGATSLAGSGLKATYKQIMGDSKKKLAQTFVNQVEGDDLFKEQIRKRFEGTDNIDQGLIALKDPEIEAIKARMPEAPTTIGMESALKPIKNVENYLYDAPSVRGEEIRKAAQDVINFTEKTVDDIWKGARNASPEEAGELIRQTFMSNVNAPWQTGLAYYSDLMGEFGGKTVSDKFRTQLANTIKKSDAFRIAKEGPAIKRVLGIVEDKSELLKRHSDELQALGLNKRQVEQIRKDGGVSNKLNKELNESGINLREFNNTLSRQAKELPETELTLSQIKELQSDIGSQMRVATGSEKKILRDTYDQLRTMMDSVIRESVGDSDTAKKIIKGLDSANASYREAYAAVEEIGQLFGIKGDFDSVLDKLQNTSTIDLNKKFLNLKKSDKALDILQKYPEIGKVVLATRQNDLLNKHLTQQGVNYAGLKKSILKMPEEEQLLYFGGDQKAKQRLLDTLTLYEKRPQTLNPSGTDIRKELREFLSPKKWVENWVLGDLYKGNESSIGRVLDAVLPGLNIVEKSANNGKKKISDSVESFLKAGQKVGKVTNKASLKYITGMNVKNEKEIEDKIGYYSQDPAAIIENFTNNNKSLIDAAPKTAEAAQSRIIKAVEFLNSKAPKKDETPFNDAQIPKSDLMKFKNYVEAVENPYSVLENLKSGYFTPESGEAIRVVYPQMFEAIKQEFLNNMGNFKLGEKQKAEISKILGLDSRKAYTPQGFNILQNISSQGVAQDMQQSAPKKVPVTASKNLNQANRSQSGVDRVIYRK
jgi:hypothetical protein